MKWADAQIQIKRFSFRDIPPWFLPPFLPPPPSVFQSQSAIFRLILRDGVSPAVRLALVTLPHRCPSFWRRKFSVEAAVQPFASRKDVRCKPLMSVNQESAFFIN